MTLSVFTMSDRQNIQEILGLPPQELTGYSELYQRLLAVEQRDLELGINKAQSIKDLITFILASLTSISTERASEGRVKRYRADGAFETEYFESPRGDRGLLAQRDELINRLKVELGYVATSPNGLIPVDGLHDYSQGIFTEDLLLR